MFVGSDVVGSDVVGWRCRFSLRTDSQFPGCRWILGSSRPHSDVYGDRENNEFGCVHHVRLSACHSARLARVNIHK